MRTHEELETQQEQVEMAKSASYSSSFLTQLLNYHRNTMFQKFCRDVYPDFKPEESCGYLSGKFGQFQYRFIAFLAELDQSRLEKLEDAISQTMTALNISGSRRFIASDKVDLGTTFMPR